MQSQAAERRPNIVWVMCDQLRWDALGCTGSGYVHTPNIDALAARGVVLRNAYCASPVCSPARASWLSGLYPHATGQLVNYGPKRADRPGCRMREDVATIADVLTADGYRCANAGVWHLGDDEHPQHGFDAGWITDRYHRDPNASLVPAPTRGVPEAAVTGCQVRCIALNGQPCHHWAQEVACKCRSKLIEPC